MGYYVVSYKMYKSKGKKVSLPWNVLVCRTHPLQYSGMIGYQICNLLSKQLVGGKFSVPYMQLSYKFVTVSNIFFKRKKKCPAHVFTFTMAISPLTTPVIKAISLDQTDTLQTPSSRDGH